MFNKMKKNNKGFTLVELLVVIAIIGILAVVAVPSLMKNINKAKAADVVSDYSAIKAAVTSAYADDDLESGTYTNGTAPNYTTTLSKSDSSSSLDIQDLSDEAGYSLTVSNDGLSATLTITTKDADIAERVAKNVGGKQGTNADNVKVTVEILKPTTSDES